MSENKPQKLAFHPVVEAPDGRVYVSPRPIKLPAITEKRDRAPP